MMTVTTRADGSDHPPGDHGQGWASLSRWPPRPASDSPDRWPNPCWRAAGRRPRWWRSGSAARSWCWRSPACRAAARGLPTARQTRRLVVYGVVAVALRPALLLQRRAVPVGRGRAAAGVSRPGAADRLALVADQDATDAPVLIGAGVAMAGMVFVLDLLTGLKLHPIGVLVGARRRDLPLRVLHPVRRRRSERDHVTAADDHGRHRGRRGRAVGRRHRRPGAAVRRHRADRARPAPNWRGGCRILLIVGVSAVFAYLSGITAVRRLGSSLGLVRGLVGGAVRGHLRRDPAGQRPTLGQARRRLGAGRYRRRPTPVRAGRVLTVEGRSGTPSRSDCTRLRA